MELAFLLCFFLISPTQAGFNFYISQQESIRLLGFEAELHYVRDGHVSTTAQHFNVPVPPTIRELCFVWENTESKPVRYSITTKASLPIVSQLSLNISSQGVIPRKPQTFCLTLPCPYRSSTSVEVTMKINFTSQNVTSLNVVMKKECTIDEVMTKVMPVEDSSYMMYIAIGVAFAVLLVVLAAVAIFFCPKHSCRSHSARPVTTNGSAVYTSVQVSCPNEEAAATVSVNSSVNHQIVEAKSSFYVQRNDVGIGGILMEGTFGTIFRGTMRIPAVEAHHYHNMITDVTIKTVKDNAAENQVNLMMLEGTRFQNLHHPNIYPLIAVVDGDGGRPLLLYPRVSHGNLKKWLLQCKGSLDGSLPHPLCTQDLVTIALHILQGVQYLHQQNVVHTDLATRNCVIDEHFHVKVTDTALSRDLFPNDYHCLGDNENRPIKWMAIESLTRREFTSGSDMWSFGVVLWEVTTLAQQPFVEVDPFEVSRVLRDGYRLTQPINCPDELYAIMAYCWAVSVHERPTAAQLYRELHKFHQQLNEYI